MALDQTAGERDTGGITVMGGRVAAAEFEVAAVAAGKKVKKLWTFFKILGGWEAGGFNNH